MNYRKSLILLAAMMMASSVSAQIVFGDPKPAPDAKPTTKPAAEATAAVDPGLEAWVQILVKRLGDQNATINSSVTSALVSVGNPALPQLQVIAAGSDAAQAKAAKDVIAQIERRGRRPGGDNARQGARSQSALLDSMNLDKATREKADKAIAAAEEKTRELFTQMQDGELSREEMRQAFREMREKGEAEMKALLGDENFEKYRSSMSNRMGGRMGGGQGGGEGPGGRRGGQGGGGQGGGGGRGGRG